MARGAHEVPPREAAPILAIVPITTPAVVIRLALILLFGRTGMVIVSVADALGLEATDWLYGFWGIYPGTAEYFAWRVDHERGPTCRLACSA